MAQALHDLFFLPTDTCALCETHPFLSTASKICAKIVSMHYKELSVCDLKTKPDSPTSEPLEVFKRIWQYRNHVL